MKAGEWMSRLGGAFVVIRLPRRSALTLLVLLGVGNPALSQSANEFHQVPPGLGPAVGPLSSVERVETATVNVEVLSAEDRVLDSIPGGGPTRFAYPIVVDLPAASTGTWQTLGDGSWLWRLRIVSPGAQSLNLAFSQFDIPEDGRLWVYDPLGGVVHGPYTAQDRTADGELWTPVVVGEEIVIELHLLSSAPDDVRLEVGRVNYGYRFFGESSPDQGWCNIDVICPQGDPWRDQIRSVGFYILSGMYICSGSMLNNLSQDLTPYFLTADHCGVTSDNADTMVFYWNFESPTCGLLSGGSLTDTQNGATLRATWSSSDFSLVELLQEPPMEYHVFYAGWDATGNTPQAVTAIHHPRGDEKALAIETDPVTTEWGTHWYIDAWTEGTTEPGSSGSGLWDAASKLLVGDLTGGYASCSDPQGADWFGKLSVSFPGGGSPSNRLKDWLDPEDTGELTCPGKHTAYVFGDGFETGDTSAWSSEMP